MCKCKKVFDRIFSTAMIIINTIYGIMVSAFGLYALCGDYYTVEKYCIGFMLSAAAIASGNAVNYFIRKTIKNY